jgi:asparagine synthase (glutamine-hydrolysing)
VYRHALRVAEEFTFSTGDAAYMQQGSDSFASGTPRFRDTVLSQHSDLPETLAAWRKQLLRGPRDAAASTAGDFAIALRDSDRTFLAVDRFAIQTICYRIDGDVLRFGVRADQVAGTRPEIDRQAIYDYLYFHDIPSPRTIYKGVYRLPPGHYALFENSRLTVAPYWRPAFDEPRSASFDALREEFRLLLRQAVGRQLDGTKPACFLSGGTDSSTVAGLIGEVSGERAATYSIGFDAAGFDEMAYARIAAAHFKTEHHEYYVTPDDLVEGIAKLASHYDQPFGNSSALPAYICQRRAREDGVTTLLAGDGGDELFGGNTRYAKQRVFGWYGQVPAALRSGILEPVLRGTPIGRLPVLRKGTSYIEQARVSMPDRLEMYNLLRRLGSEAVLTPSFLAQVDVDAPMRQQREVWASSSASSELNRMLAFDWRYTLAENDLPKVCGTAALAGMRVAFPLLDDELLEFSLRLPTDYKLRGLTLRWFFKQALRDFLPDRIIAKRKHGFGLPFGVWVVRHPALNRLAADALRALARRGIVRGDFIDTLLSTHLAEHPSYYGELIWVLMVLEFWLRDHAADFVVT